MKTAMLVVLSAAVSVNAAPRVLTLSEALGEAAKLNPEVQIARLRIVEREAQALNAASARQPQVSAVVAGAYQTSSLVSIGVDISGLTTRLGPYGLLNARPVVTQTVVDLGLISAIRGARERATEAREWAVVARETTQFAVAQLYIDALRADARAASANARIKIASGVLKQTSERHEAGAASKLDVVRAEQQVQSERVTAVTAKRDGDVLRTMLARVIGSESADFALEPPAVREFDVADVKTVEAEAAGSRAEVKALAARVRAASQDQAQAVRQRLPKVSAFADFGFLGQSPVRGVSTYTVGGAVTIPLWTGGRISAEVAAAGARVAQAEHQQRDARLEIAQQVRESLIGLAASREAEEAARLGVAAARETVELARLRFAEGISTNLDVVQAQRALGDAEEKEIRAKFDSLTAVAQLARARGDVGSMLK